MRYKVVYGIRSDDIDDAARKLAKALNVEFEPRHGDARGNYYRFKGPDNESIYLQHNYMPFDMEWFAEDHKKNPLILEMHYDGPETRYEAVLSRMKSVHSDMLWRYRYGPEGGQSRKLFSRLPSRTNGRS